MPEFIAGNLLTLLETGADYFPALEQAIDAAQVEIHLQTYILSSDVTGLRIAEALKRAARRGVACYIVVDGFGSRDYLPRAMIDDLRGVGIALVIFRPEPVRLIPQRERLRRMHRKMALMDDTVAFVGGINIIDDFYTPKHTPPRFDYAVRIEGPLVEELRVVVHRLWELMSLIYEQTRWRSALPVRAASPRASTRAARAHFGPHTAALIVRDNLAHRNDIEDAYLEAIAGARSEVLIANAYFFPGLRFRRELAAAAQRGVRVILLLQGRVEYVWLHYAARALYGSLLEAGVEIMEYHKSFMHAKVAVIDRVWATVGSSNIDPFSFILSREANVLVRDAAFAVQLRESLERAMAAGAAPIQRDQWQQRSWIGRATSWAAYQLGRIAMGIVGVSQQ